MGISVKELPSICENALPTVVTVVLGAWQEDDGDSRLLYGDKSRKEIDNLPQGRCTQANLPEGCLFVSACTGKVRYDIDLDQKGVILLTVSNSAKKAPRQYTK